MARHSEIKVGDTKWVIRIAGADVRVKVMDKTQKASGRGYDFRLRRIGTSGRVEGRNLTRGSGAMRMPGDPVKAFGGKSTGGRKAKAVFSKRRSSKPKPKAKAPTVTNPRLVSHGWAAPSAPAAPRPTALESLRGKRRPTPRVAAALKPKPKPIGLNRIEVKVPNELVGKAIRALSRLPKSAHADHVRNVVAGVLVEYERARYAAPGRYY